MPSQHPDIKYEPIAADSNGSSFDEDARTDYTHEQSDNHGSAHLLPKSERELQSNSCSSSEPIRRPWLIAIFLLSIVATTFVAGVGGYYYGRVTEKEVHNLDWFSPPGTIDHTFHYRKGFSMRPGKESQKYWNMIFPRGRGFIQHPTISPEPHGLAVYHQLHCLDAIRRGYYAAVDGIELDMSDHHNAHAAPGHVRHCIDYLRQSLMCNADTNLEPIDMTLGGVTGFGNERKCRDIVRIMQFAEKWRTHNQTIIT